MGRINVFIGPQVAGKSVIAKLLFFFKDGLRLLFDGTIIEAKKRDKHFLNTDR